MNNFCKAPWSNLFVDTDGKVRFCCPGGYIGDLNNQTLEEILYSDKVKQIKTEIINNEPTDYCKNCRRNEQTCGESLRKSFDHINVSSEILASNSAFELKSLDIRWNSLCNLACVYCNEKFSTVWQKYLNIPQHQTSAPYYEEILDFVKNNKDNIEQVFMLGGEPLLNKENIDLCSIIPDNCQVRIFTNLKSNLHTNKVFKKLKNRPFVQWVLSFENINERFEYVRLGASWEQHKNNVKLVNSIEGHGISTMSVYCIYTALCLTELFEFANDNALNLSFMNINQPSFMNILNFSEQIKQAAVAQIDLVLSTDYPNIQHRQSSNVFLKTIRDTIVNSPANNCNSEFLEWCDKFDNEYAKGKKSFADLWPETYEIIKNSI